MIKLSRNELKTLFYIGRKLVLVHSLLGPTEKPRTIQAQKSFGYIMETPEGKPSWLRFESGETIFGENEGNGFTHITIKTKEGEIAARYQLL